MTVGEIYCQSSVSHTVSCVFKLVGCGRGSLGCFSGIFNYFNIYLCKCSRESFTVFEIVGNDINGVFADGEIVILAH